MATLTVFTPAYNRAYTLHKCYESLKRQTSKDFVWLIIDDGSTDHTKELVSTWIEQNEIPIQKSRKESVRTTFQASMGIDGLRMLVFLRLRCMIHTPERL